VAQEKKEPGFFKKLIDSHKVLGNDITDEGMRRYFWDVKSIIEQHTYRAFKTEFILNKLAQFAAEGKINQVTSLLNIRPDLRKEVLFTLAGLGAQDEMEQILKQHPEDLLVYHPLRDISGAQFESISVFQHCLWTKDVRYMANMMLDCLPKNEKGEAIRLELVRQYKEHMAHGATYQLKGMRHENERHFNFQPLISALRTYVDNYNHWTEKERELNWHTVVGMAQTLIPAHIRHHYCDPEEAFWDNPNFKKPKLKRSLEIYNWVLNKSQVWSEGLAGLGSDFGIYGCPRTLRRTRRGLARGRASADGAAGAANLVALTTLDKARTEIDLPTLIDRLHTPIQNLEDDLDVQSMKF
jgi:hypothetical protein